MTRNKIKYIALASCGVLVILIVSIRARQNKPHNKSDTTLVGGAYLDIEKVVIQNHHRSDPGADTSYNLYLSQSDQPYIISDVEADCFMYGAFKQEVREGDFIKIYVSDKTENVSTGQKAVYCVLANNKEYLSFDCVNRVNDEQVRYLPFLLAVVLMFIVGIAYLRTHM